MSQGIVDILKVIEIQKQHGELPVMPSRQPNRLGEVLREQISVRQVGQRVVLGQMRHLKRFCTGRVYGPKDDYRTGNISGSAGDRSGGIFDGNFLPVPANKDAVP